MASQKTCDICYEDRFEFDFGYLPCAHSFCTTCLGKLMHDVCPMCRHPFNEYSQQECSYSLPNEPVTIPVQLSEQARDDLYIEETAQLQRRQERQRHVRRRRQRRLRTRRRRRRSEVVEEIFQIDDLITEDDTTQNEVKGEENRRTNRRTNRRGRKPRGDNWQILRTQRPHII